MNWFGEPWPSAELRAPVCEDDKLRIPSPPVWELCVLCNQPFAADARGVRMPHITAELWTVERYCHLGCLLGNVGGEGISWREG
ncbi:MAG TPA: hypothetical protein VJ617_19960 [Arthrobacter sp.]|nr:hypothetical protein [Arthrobacter sp.]